MTSAPLNNSQQSALAPSDSFKVYRPPVGDVTSLVDLPDSFFNPTAADIRLAQSQLSARTDALINAPLQLKAKRTAVEQTKFSKWPNTTIRIRFPDRTQLEKTFSSTDKIRSVYAFVRSSLRDDIKPIKFVLYQSPPKRDLKVSDPKVRDLTLAELQLAPSSVLLLRFEDASLNGTTIVAPLQESILAQAVDFPVHSSPSSIRTTVDSALQSSSDGPSSSMGISPEKKTPKWFKMNTKK